MKINKSESPWLMGCALFFIFTLLYFLSYGPMSWLYDQSTNDFYDIMYEIIYLPMELLEESPLADVLYWYGDLWYL